MTTLQNVTIAGLIVSTITSLGVAISLRLEVDELKDQPPMESSPLNLSVGSTISVGQCAINADYSWELFTKDTELATLCKKIWVENPWLLFPHKHDALIPDQWHPQRKTK